MSLVDDRRLRVVHGREGIDLPAARRAVADLLVALGRDPRSEHLADTPRRVAHAYAEMLTPREFDLTTFPNDEDYRVAGVRRRRVQSGRDGPALNVSLRIQPPNRGQGAPWRRPTTECSVRIPDPGRSSSPSPVSPADSEESREYPSVPPAGISGHSAG